jgi:hypothetical protein
VVAVRAKLLPKGSLPTVGKRYRSTVIPGERRRDVVNVRAVVDNSQVVVTYRSYIHNYDKYRLMQVEDFCEPYGLYVEVRQRKAST